MRWQMLALLFFARIGLGFQFQTLASVGDNLVVAFGFDYAQIGLLIGLFMAPGLFLALPAGFSGRFASDRILAGMGLAALSVGGIVSGLGTDGLTIGLGRVIAGAGFLFATLYFSKMIADWFEGREIATAMSILVMSWPFGIAMGQIGHTWLAQTFDWHTPFFVASAYCGVAALAVTTIYRPPNDQTSLKGSAKLSMKPQEWRLVVCAGIAWGVFNAGYVVYLAFAPNVLVSLGSSTLTAASIVSFGSWIMIVSGTVCGLIADRFGRRDLILMICMTSAVVALLLIQVPGAGIPASLLFGLLGMAPAGVIMALIGQAVRAENRAFGMGVFFTVYYAIMTASPPIAGYLFDIRERADDPLVFGMALFAVVVPASLIFRYFKSATPAGPHQKSA
ncbi:MAG: MFS transporter [Rhizobiaceae bacterium]|nr:MFS transporter [Rhizobiaceae bacterium]